MNERSQDTKRQMEEAQGRRAGAGDMDMRKEIIGPCELYHGKMEDTIQISEYASSH